MKTLAERLREDARLLDDTACPSETVALLREAAEALDLPAEDEIKEALVGWEGAIYEDEHGGASADKLEDARQGLLNVLRRCREAVAIARGPLAGWKLVPIEPTLEMKEAGGKYRDETGAGRTVGGYYRAMVAAAPIAP